MLEEWKDIDDDAKDQFLLVDNPDDTQDGLANPLYTFGFVIYSYMSFLKSLKVYLICLSVISIIKMYLLKGGLSKSELKLIT